MRQIQDVLYDIVLSYYQKISENKQPSIEVKFQLAFFLYTYFEKDRNPAAEYLSRHKELSDLLINCHEGLHKEGCSKPVAKKLRNFLSENIDLSMRYTLKRLAKIAKQNH